MLGGDIQAGVTWPEEVGPMKPHLGPTLSGTALLGACSVPQTCPPHVSLCLRVCVSRVEVPGPRGHMEASHQAHPRQAEGLGRWIRA